MISKKTRLPTPTKMTGAILGGFVKNLVICILRVLLFLPRGWSGAYGLGAWRWSNHRWGWRVAIGKSSTIRLCQGFLMMGFCLIWICVCNVCVLVSPCSSCVYAQMSQQYLYGFKRLPTFFITDCKELSPGIVFYMILIVWVWIAYYYIEPWVSGIDEIEIEFNREISNTFDHIRMYKYIWRLYKVITWSFPIFYIIFVLFEFLAFSLLGHSSNIWLNYIHWIIMVLFYHIIL